MFLIHLLTTGRCNGPPRSRRGGLLQDGPDRRRHHDGHLHQELRIVRRLHRRNQDPHRFPQGQLTGILKYLEPKTTAFQNFNFASLPDMEDCFVFSREIFF